jgi:hypothetical protein
MLEGSSAAVIAAKVKKSENSIAATEGDQTVVAMAAGSESLESSTNLSRLCRLSRDAGAVQPVEMTAPRIEAMRSAGLIMTLDHHFLCLPAWPIYHALSQHGLMQNTDCKTSHEELTSPRRDLALPEFLRPSPLQLAMPHARWIDRFPFPRMRDNMILLRGVVDLVDFIQDLFGMSSLLVRPGVQRATWDPDCWVMGPEFQLKWGYLFL